MDSIVGKLLRAAGMTGNGLSLSTLVPPPATINPDKVEADFSKDGAVQNPDIWTSFNSAMRRPRTFEEAIHIWDEMCNWDLMAAALSEIAEEAIQTDGLSPATIWYECGDKKIEEDLNDMLVTVGAEDVAQSQVWHVSSYGNDFEQLEYAKGEGVLGMSYIHPMDIRRYWLAKNRRCVGFRIRDRKPDKDSVFKLDGYNDIFPRASLTLSGSGSGKSDVEELWYPWDIMHMRRMHRGRLSEHGEPLFDEAQGIYKKLRIALDQMVVHRAQVQPDRYVVNVDVKDQIPADQLRTVQRWKQNLRSKLAFGAAGANGMGGVDEFKSYYNAMALDTVLWIAKPRDFQHGVEKLAGTTSIPDVYDIEMLTNLFFSIIGMPKSWIGLGDSSGGGGPASGKALLAQDMRFLRKIKSIRRPVIQAYTWLGYFHLLLKGHDIRNIDIVCKMPPIGSLEDQMKLELLKTQAEVLGQLGEVMDMYKIPREAWIEVVFQHYMKLPDEVVAVFQTALPAEGGQEESKRYERTPNLKKLLEEVRTKLDPVRKDIMGKITDVLDGRAPSKKNRRYRNLTEVLQTSKIKDGDVIVSGYGQIDPLNVFKPIVEGGSTVTERLVNHPGFRAEKKETSRRDLMEAHIKSNSR